MYTVSTYYTVGAVLFILKYTMCIIYTICRGQLQALLEIAYRGLQDKDIAVRNASFFAIGQFSDHLQVSERDTGAWMNLREGNWLN